MNNNFWSVELKSTGFTDDTFCGKYHQCINYITSSNIDDENFQLAHYINDECVDVINGADIDYTPKQRKEDIQKIDCENENVNLTTFVVYGEFGQYCTDHDFEEIEVKFEQYCDLKKIAKKYANRWSVFGDNFAGWIPARIAIFRGNKEKFEEEYSQSEVRTSHIANTTILKEVFPQVLCSYIEDDYGYFPLNF